jgi:hypothetical protein
MGMAENPGESYSLGSRVICGKCGVTPQIKDAAKITGPGPYQVTALCHGEEETKFIERSQLVFTTVFFEQPEA